MPFRLFGRRGDDAPPPHTGAINQSSLDADDRPTAELLRASRRGSQAQRIMLSLLLFGLACALLGGLTQRVLSDNQDQAITSLVTTLRDTCDAAPDARLPSNTQSDCARVRAGGEPVVVEQLRGPRGAAGEPGNDGEDGPMGQTGATGQAGPTGAPGRDGTDGVNGTNGRDGSNGADGNPGLTGPPGAPGASPPCLDTPEMCQGADGEPGQAGQPPVSWTTTNPDGSTTSCSRVEPFDPAAPRYTCTTSAP